MKLDQMNDIELARAVAERVMGWPIHQYKDGWHPHQGDHEFFDNPANYPNLTMPAAGDMLYLWTSPHVTGVEWDPVENVSQALLTLIKLTPEWRFRLDLWEDKEPRVLVSFYRGLGLEGYSSEVPKIGRAICIAALQAAGA